MDFHTAVQQTVDFVRLNQAWAVPIVFALAFGESLAFISLLIPAWGALVAIGALIGSSGIKFWPIWVAASLGAAFGDWRFVLPASLSCSIIAPFCGALVYPCPPSGGIAA